MSDLCTELGQERWLVTLQLALRHALPFSCHVVGTAHEIGRVQAATTLMNG